MATDVVALEALKQALSLEREGIRFYQEASERVEDIAGQEMFMALANDEQDHRRMLTAQIRSLKVGKGWRPFPQTANVEPLKGPPTLFPEGKVDLEKVVSPGSTEIDAIRFGLDIENRSFEFYFKAFQESKVAEAKDMYSFLAEMERGHFNTLMMRYEGLGGPVGWRY